MSVGGASVQVSKNYGPHLGIPNNDDHGIIVYWSRFWRCLFMESLEDLPMFWSQIPSTATVSYTSNRPQTDMGKYCRPIHLHGGVGDGFGSRDVVHVVQVSRYRIMAHGIRKFFNISDMQVPVVSC